MLLFTFTRSREVDIFQLNIAAEMSRFLSLDFMTPHLEKPSSAYTGHQAASYPLSASQDWLSFVGVFMGPLRDLHRTVEA